MNTTELIDLLVKDLEPIRLLPRPSVRTAEWLVTSLSYVILVVLVVSPRADLWMKVSDWHFVFEQTVVLATAIAAASAAFRTVVPGYGREFLTLTFLLLSIWLARLGQVYVQGDGGNWIGPGSLWTASHPFWYCLPAIVLVGLVPAIAITMKLHRGALLAPHLTAALGGLAAAALGSFGLRFFCPLDTSLIVLVWQFGIVCTLAAIAGSLADLILGAQAKAARSIQFRVRSTNGERTGPP